jgi:hypothetical protein
MLHGSNFDSGLREIVAMCSGGQTPKATLLSRAIDYVHSHDVVEDSVADDVDTTWFLMQSAYRERETSERGKWTRCREKVRNDLMGAGCPGGVVDRALAQCDGGQAPLILGQQQRQKILTWLRASDELSVRFAVDLWHQRTRGGGRGVTLNWVFAFLRRNHTDVQGRQYYEASGQYEWKGRELVDKAFTAGLLVRSTEVPRGHYEKLDAQSNPSYDFGPNVFSIGKLAAAFLRSIPLEPVESQQKFQQGGDHGNGSVDRDETESLW